MNDLQLSFSWGMAASFLISLLKRCGLKGEAPLKFANAILAGAGMYLYTRFQEGRSNTEALMAAVNAVFAAAGTYKFISQPMKPKEEKSGG